MSLETFVKQLNKKITYERKQRACKSGLIWGYMRFNTIQMSVKN
jgi:hypothetical protein